MAKKVKKQKSGNGSRKTSGTLKAVAQSPLLADIVAAALVATASALKDPKKARRLASDAGDELGNLTKKGAQDGSALWDMALQIGRRSLEALGGEKAPKATKQSGDKSKSSGNRKDGKKSVKKQAASARNQ